MKAWIVGDSFANPCKTSDIFYEKPSVWHKFVDDGTLPDNDLVKGTEWVKQVVTGLGYEYITELNISIGGSCNHSILHNVDWVLHNVEFDKEVDLIVIIPTASSRFMWRAQDRGANDEIFEFTERKTPHLNTAGSWKTGNPVIDQYNTLYRDHEFEYYRTVSTYDKLLAFLNLHNIDYLFCNGFWSHNAHRTSPSNFTGYTPQHINFNFPQYEIGLEADARAFPDVQNIADLYTNHFTHIGNDAYASAVLEYINERR